jgi:hypothetical protein
MLATKHPNQEKQIVKLILLAVGEQSPQAQMVFSLLGFSAFFPPLFQVHYSTLT